MRFSHFFVVYLCFRVNNAYYSLRVYLPYFLSPFRHCQKVLEQLPEPKRIWKYMLALTQIPRGSNKNGELVNNKRVTAFLKETAEELGCETYVDKGENLIIRKKATPGL